MSMPTSSMTSATAGLMQSAGSLPAEPDMYAAGSAIVEERSGHLARPAFSTQTNNTSGTVFTQRLGLPDSGEALHEPETIGQYRNVVVQAHLAEPLDAFVDHALDRLRRDNAGELIGKIVHLLLQVGLRGGVKVRGHAANIRCRLSPEGLHLVTIS